MVKARSRKKPASPRPRPGTEPASGRFYWLLALFALALCGLLWRAIYLHTSHKDFLQEQGDARLLRVLDIPVARATLYDRNGEILAASTPVDSAWFNPHHIDPAAPNWPALFKLLDRPADSLNQLLEGREQRGFIYLQRHLSPETAAQIRALDLDGVYLQREYRRYYPTGPATAHLIGFTDIDDHGQEGLELSLDAQLRGAPGQRKVIQDRRGRVLANVAQLQAPQPGETIHLSIDRRLSSLTRRALAKAVREHKAKAAAAVLLDARSAEVLAAVTYPGYNPNNRADRDSRRYRNRAITDVFEPGSTIKPFTIAAALESGDYTPASRINTAPGRLKLGRFEVNDPRNYGLIDLRTVLRKSSNVGAARLALKLPAREYWELLSYTGFGEYPRSGFPGEARGKLPFYADWSRARQASIGFGYGLNTSLLQLAHAYSLFAGDGSLRPLSLFRQTPQELAEQRRVQLISAATAQHIRLMLEAVVSAADGTGKRARIPGYRVAGKTGTARKHQHEGYATNRYIALFTGLAPVSEPRLVLAVMLDEPQGRYYGGQVAAPLFAEIMGGALRLSGIAPDALPQNSLQ